MWNIINNVTREADKSSHLLYSFKMNNKEVSTVKTTEAFNNNFLNMANDSQIKTDNHISPISLLKNANENDF